MDAILIRRKPAEEILKGLKTWEIRGSNTKKRGRVAIAVSGTSMLYGEVDLVDSIPLTRTLWNDNTEKHRNYISWYDITGVYASPYAWVMKNPIIYDKPRKYKHPYGAVIWVKNVAAESTEKQDTAKSKKIRTPKKPAEAATSGKRQLIEKDQDAKKVQATYVKEKYMEYVGSFSHISADNYYDKQTKKIIKEAIADIVAIEGPISQPELTRILISKTSLGRAGKQIAEYLDKLIAASNIKITRQSGVRFLWSYGTNPDDYMIYRIKPQRNPEGICKYELKNAVCYLIQENGPMTKDEIIKSMVSMFGYSRFSKKLESGANAAIKAALGLNAIELGVDKKYRNV